MDSMVRIQRKIHRVQELTLLELAAVVENHDSDQHLTFQFAGQFFRFWRFSDAHPFVEDLHMTVAHASQLSTWALLALGISV
jgi:hypothetical protein